MNDRRSESAAGQATKQQRYPWWCESLKGWWRDAGSAEAIRLDEDGGRHPRIRCPILPTHHRLTPPGVLLRAPQRQRRRAPLDAVRPHGLRRPPYNPERGNEIAGDRDAQTPRRVASGHRTLTRCPAEPSAGIHRSLRDQGPSANRRSGRSSFRTRFAGCRGAPVVRRLLPPASGMSISGGCETGLRPHSACRTARSFPPERHRVQPTKPSFRGSSGAAP